MKHIATLSALLLASTMTLQATTYLKRDGWNWSASSTCKAGGNGNDYDITGLQGMYDDNSATCWHSNFLAGQGMPERSNPHWVQIDRGTDRSEFNSLSYLPRQSTANQACTSYYVYVRDTDMSSTPATSAADIVKALGSPDASGTWAGDTNEKFAVLEKPSTARYILFVNVASLNSSSAACAEMNLCSGATSGGDPSTNSYNSIKITPTTGVAHRIAILDGSLAMSMSYGYVRLSNSDITIEYSPAEVERFDFEHYDFGDESYEGTKKDVLTSTFPYSVKPEEGMLETLDEVSITITPARQARLNPAATEPITIVSEGKQVMSVQPDALATFTENGKVFKFSGLGQTTAGTYTLHIPAGIFIAIDGSRSEGMDRNWVIASGQNSIAAVTDDTPTLTLSHEGGQLNIGGISKGGTVELYNIAGQCVTSAPVNQHRQATLPVSGLPKGVYLLNVNDITLKIIL